MTKEFLKSLIVSMLGGSQVDVELTQDDLDMIIYFSINYYVNYSSDGLNEEWRVIRLKANQNFHEIDDDIEYILDINSDGTAIGNLLIPFTTGQAYEIAMLGQTLENNMSQFLNTPVLTKIMIKDGKKVVQSDIRVTQDKNFAAKVLTFKDLSELYKDPWIQRYAIAQAKMMLGAIRSKFQSISSPNDAAMNGSDLISQGQQEITDLRQELFDRSVLTAGGIFIG